MADNKEESDAATLKELKEQFHSKKVGDQSIWKMTLETLGMADGKKGKMDHYSSSKEEALELLRELIPSPEAFVVDVGIFDATTDDLLLAFIEWAKSIDTKTNMTHYNVTKAAGRLQNYFKWMDEHKEDLQGLTTESVRIAAVPWSCLLTHDGEDRLVWWIDLGKLDSKFIRNELAVRDSLRYVVWMSHIVMLDLKAQQNGMVLVEAMGHKGMMDCLTMIPMEVGAQMDRLTIGILPIKMKKVYMFQSARWMKLLLGIMKPFMSAKMRSRIVVLKDDDSQQTLDDLFGRIHIPENFGGLVGGKEEDIIFGIYFPVEA